MSLVSTLAKVAVGVMVVKGVGKMMSGQSGAGGGGGLGDLLGAGRGAGAGQGSPGGANPGTGSIFGDLFSPGAQRGSASGDAGSGGGLGDLGSLGQILAGRLGGAGSAGNAAGGGLGGLLEGLSQASRPRGSVDVAQPSPGSLGDLLNQSLERFSEPETPPAPEHEEAAKLMLRAMIQAAKSDGRIDAHEKEKLLGKLGEITPQDMAFIESELARPLDPRGLARDVPPGMGEQVYAMSVLAIDLDNQQEARYLAELANALRLDPADANAIHDRMGAPRIFA